MKTTKYRKIEGNGGGRKCEIIEYDAEKFHKDQAAEGPEWVTKETMIQLKSMAQVLGEYDCWFDVYGNLCSERGQLAPAHFKQLGETFHVHVGCGFDNASSDWIVAERYKNVENL